MLEDEIKRELKCNEERIISLRRLIGSLEGRNWQLQAQLFAHRHLDEAGGMKLIPHEPELKRNK